MSVQLLLQFLCQVIHGSKSQQISALVHPHSTSKRDQAKTPS